LLSLVAIVRLVGFGAGWHTETLTSIELVLGMLLVVCVLPRDPRRGVATSLVAVALVAALGWGVAKAPIDTLLVLALVHNLTPVGFLADRLGDEDWRTRGRAPWLVAGGVCFVAVPVFLAAGGASLLGALGPFSTDADANAGATLGLTLHDGVGAFVPRFFPSDRALDLFRAAAFLQCMHYVAVLLVMPRLGSVPAPGPRSSAEAQPPPHRDLAFTTLVASLGAVFLVAFALDFRQSKAAYGILAAVHAWIEFPALLLALTPRVALRAAL
jgi:hypothetical protein